MIRKQYGKPYEREVGQGFSTVAVSQATYPVQAIYKNAADETLFVKAWDVHGSIILDLDYTLTTTIVDKIVANKVVIVDKIKNPESNLPEELA